MSDEEYREIDKPWNRDAAEISDRLTAWAVKTIDAHAVATVIDQPGGSGFSSETLLFDLRRGADAAVEQYVARLAPLPSLIPVFPSTTSSSSSAACSSSPRIRTSRCRRHRSTNRTRAGSARRSS